MRTALKGKCRVLFIESMGSRRIVVALENGVEIANEKGITSLDSVEGQRNRRVSARGR